MITYCGGDKKGKVLESEIYIKKKIKNPCGATEPYIYSSI